MAKDNEFEVVLRLVDEATGKMKNVEATVVKGADKMTKKMLSFKSVFRAVFFGNIINGAIRNVKALGRAMTIDFVKSSLTAASTVEQFEFRLKALTGSQEAASKKMSEFMALAKEVPASLEEIIDAGVSLEAFGANSEEWTESMVDLSFVMGVTVPEAASAFGRAFAGGVGAADVFRERGILQIIKDFKGIDDITKLTLPDFRDAMRESFTDQTGKIAGAAREAMGTWRGQVSLLQDAMFQLRAETGKHLINNTNLSKTIKEIVKILGSPEALAGAKALAAVIVDTSNLVIRAGLAYATMAGMAGQYRAELEKGIILDNKRNDLIGKQNVAVEEARERLQRYNAELEKLNKQRQILNNLAGSGVEFKPFGLQPGKQFSDQITAVMRLVKNAKKELSDLQEVARQARGAADEIDQRATSAIQEGGIGLGVFHVAQNLVAVGFNQMADASDDALDRMTGGWNSFTDLFFNNANGIINITSDMINTRRFDAESLIAFTLRIASAELLSLSKKKFAIAAEAKARGTLAAANAVFAAGKAAEAAAVGNFPGAALFLAASGKFGAASAAYGVTAAAATSSGIAAGAAGIALGIGGNVVGAGSDNGSTSGSSGGRGSGRTAVGPGVDTNAQSDGNGRQVDVHIQIQGNVIGNQQFIRDLADELKLAAGDGADYGFNFIQ